MKDQAALVLATIVALPLAACGHAQIPYDYASVEAAPRPVHALRVAVVPLVDARTKDDASDDASRFTYQGVEFVFTDLRRLRGGATRGLTTMLARHLAHARVFAQVILVDAANDAPEADLVLTGQLRRARGYVESEARDEASGKPVDQRTVLAEVFFADLELRDTGQQRRVLLRADAGWSVLAEVSSEPEAPTPWTVLSDALRPALDRFTTLVADADLSGAYVVADQVALATGTSTTGLFGRLADTGPTGWRWVRTATATPVGWRGDVPCEAANYEAQQSLRFHRALGPYVPTVSLWACPTGRPLKYDSLEAQPALYIGRGGGRWNYFVRQVGASNWPKAAEQVTAHLGVHPPAQRYVFEVQ